MAAVVSRHYVFEVGFKTIGKWKSRIYLTLLETNGLTGVELATRIGYLRWFTGLRGQQALYQMLHRLKKEGMLESGTWGQYYLTKEGQEFARRLV